MKQDYVVVVLAAGLGTRLKSERAKVLHRAGGRTLIETLIRAVTPLASKGVYAVVGHQADEVRAVVEPLGAKAILQVPQLGTGHAMMVARPVTEGLAGHALVLPGDAPLITTATLGAFVASHFQTASAATILTARLDDPTGYGRIVRRSDGCIAAIVEQSALTAETAGVNEINSGIYCFQLQKLYAHIDRLRRENIHREYYLTDVIALLVAAGEKVSAYTVADPAEVLGINTRVELADADRRLRERKLRALMLDGVTIYRPETCLIDPEVEVGRDTVIEPGVILSGATRIGVGCIIRANNVIEDSEIGDGALVKPCCLITGSRIGAEASIGPFARIRDGANIGPKTRVGNFVEVKKSALGEGTKASHLSYLGDATIGRDVNVGAGTITCNYDGEKKNPTTIGDNVFIGSGTELVAPVKVGSGAYVGAGSTITEDVPADALAIARARQVNKENWVKERKKKRR